jgi:hypothetical protein
MMEERKLRQEEENKSRSNNRITDDANINLIKEANQEEQIDELIEPFIYLEGQCYVDPRNRRLYEVVMITYCEKLKIIAAYRRVTDNEPPEENDNELVIVEGAHGLAELVKEFTDQGGNCGNISDSWPNTDIAMAIEQQKDDKLNSIIQQLKGLQAKSTIMVEGTTYTLHSMDGSLRKKVVKDKNVQMLVVIPPHLITHVLQFHHESIGHPGEDRMTSTITLRYWWPKWRQYIHDHVSQCMFCQRRKPSRNGKIPIQE